MFWKEAGTTTRTRLLYVRAENKRSGRDAMMRLLCTLHLVAISASPAGALPHTPKTLLGVPYPRGSTTELDRIQRIEYVAITVSSLEKAASFYGTVMGGTEIEFCKASTSNPHCTPEGYVRISGDGHFDAMFGNDDADYPNISATGQVTLSALHLGSSNVPLQLLSVPYPKTHQRNQWVAHLFPMLIPYHFLDPQTTSIHTVRGGISLLCPSQRADPACAVQPQRLGHTFRSARADDLALLDG